MRVEVWADIVCPWCYLGKRRLERALAEFASAEEVEVVWRSFQLDPSFPAGVRQPVFTYLAEKFRADLPQVRQMTAQVRSLAAQEGLDLRADRAQMVNTLDAHRLTHLAGRHGLQDPMQERLMRAHHTEGEAIDDPSTLLRLGTEVGVPAEDIRQLLDGDSYAEQARQDLQQAARLGVSGVPFFLFNGAHAVAGAQPAATLLAGLAAAAPAGAPGSRG